MSTADILSVALITHDDAVQWFKKLPDTKCIVITDYHHSIARIALDYPEPDLYLIHPKDPADRNYNAIQSHAILFSDEYLKDVEWLIDNSVVRLSKNVLFNYWDVVIKHMVGSSHDFKGAIEALQRQKATLEDADRHDMRNRLGPRLTVEIAVRRGDLSRQFLEQIQSGLDLQLSEDNIDKVSSHAFPMIKYSVGLKGLWPDGRHLLIDDQHIRGWSTIFSAILLGDTTKAIKVNYAEKLSGENSVPGLFAMESVGDVSDSRSLELLWSSLNVTDPDTTRIVVPYDLLLLDYRVKDEKTTDADSISGKIILQYLHKIDPSLPVILVTGSEKARTVLQLQEHGLLSYYLKPKAMDEEAEFNYQRLRQSILAARKHRYIRDLWRLCLLIRHEKPALQPLFEQDAFRDHLARLDGFNGGTAANQLRECLARALERAVTLLGMDMKTDAECLSGGISLVREVVQRLSLVSDVLIGYGSPYRGLTGKGMDAETLYSANVCRVIRNIVSHTADPCLDCNDLILQVLCITRIMLRDKLPDDCLQAISSYYKEFADAGNADYTAFFYDWFKQSGKTAPKSAEATDPLRHVRNTIDTWDKQNRPTDRMTYAASCLALALVHESSRTTPHTSGDNDLLRRVLLNRMEHLFKC